MRSILPIFCLIVVIIGCNHSPETAGEDNSNHIDSTTEVLDSTTVDTFIQTPQSRLSNLREILRVELKRKGNRKDTFLVFTDEATIERIDFVASVFSTSKIDSVGLYGFFDAKKEVNRLPMETLSVLYYKDSEAAIEDFNALQKEWFQHFDEVERLFKPGGVVFVMDEKICLRPVVTCYWGNNKLLRVDSLIAQNCFAEKPFTRLLLRCGFPKFEKKTE